MKEVGITIRGMEKAMRDMLMVVNMREISKILKLMDEGFIYGLMGRYMMGNGQMGLKRVMEYGLVYMEIHI